MMQLKAFLPFRIARLASKTSAAISQIYGERFGLSRDEWRVLAATGEAELQPTRAVAEQTGLDKVAISRAASSLEDRGLIERSEDRRDRRIKILRLSEKGRRVLAEIERVARAREAYLLEGLTESERACFEAAIEKLVLRAETLAAPETGDRCRPDCGGGCGDRVELEEPVLRSARRGPARAPAPALSRC